MRRLPEFRQAPGPDAPALKRLLLPQGELAQICEASPALRYIAAVQLCPGRVRGNHYHKKKHEFVYVVAGRATLVCGDVATDERYTIPMEAGVLVSIGTGVAHALAADTDGVAVEYSPAAFDPDDVYPHPVIKA